MSNFCDKMDRSHRKAQVFVIRNTRINLNAG